MFGRAPSADQEFEHELVTHLEMLTDENIRRGMAPDAARRAARIRLGGLTQLQEANRELRGLPVIHMFLQDTCFAFRMLRKNPGFTAVAVGHLLFNVSTSDPATLAAVAFALAAVATLAGYVPARCAMRVDPIVALRYE